MLWDSLEIGKAESALGEWSERAIIERECKRFQGIQRYKQFVNSHTVEEK